LPPPSSSSSSSSLFVPPHLFVLNILIDLFIVTQSINQLKNSKRIIMKKNILIIDEVKTLDRIGLRCNLYLVGGDRAWLRCHKHCWHLWSFIIFLLETCGREWKKKNKVFFVIIRKNLIKSDIGIKIKQNNEGLISIHVRCHEVWRSKILIFS